MDPTVSTSSATILGVWIGGSVSNPHTLKAIPTLTNLISPFVIIFICGSIFKLINISNDSLTEPV